MTKKMYKQPQTSTHYVSAKNIICTSPGFGEKQEGSSDKPVFGD